jgi:aspartate kinase
MNGHSQSYPDVIYALKDAPETAAKSNWVVQKFGGTSVGKFAHNIIDQVVLYVYYPGICPHA